MKSILVIEDDRKIAMALTLRLKCAGYEAIMAHDARSGIQAAVHNRPHLLLLDIGLPDSDGFAAAQEIQSLVPALIPFIFITASKEPAFRERATQLGAAGFFEKPYEADELLAAIQKALG